MSFDDYAEDSRFLTFDSMLDNCDAGYEIVGNANARLSLAECKKRLTRGTQQWTPIQDARDLANGESLIATGWIAKIVNAEGNPQGPR